MSGTTPSTAQSQFYSSTTYLQNINSLPAIKGTWYFVNPKSGSDSALGNSIATAFATVSAAYAACTDGAGDGICVLSYVASASTSAMTTTYLYQPLVWAKSGITMVGLNAGQTIFNRSRIANKDVTSAPGAGLTSFTTTVITRTDTGSFVTDGWVIGMTGTVTETGGTDANNAVSFTVTGVTASTLSASAAPFTGDSGTAGGTETVTLLSYMATLINVTGNNNLFINIELWNGGAQAQSLGGVQVSGIRNHFVNCHFIGGAGCTAAATTYSLQLATGAKENVFDNCVIGTDTVDRGNNANGELSLNATTADGRAIFNSCLFTSYTSTGVAHGAIKSLAATAMGRHTLFNNCIFENYTPNLGADQTAAFVGTNLTTAKLIFHNCISCGYAEWAPTSNGCVFVDMATSAASAAGGIATTK